MNEWGVWATLVGVWGWIACVLIFIYRVFPARGVFVAKQAVIWGGACLVFFACWIMGMLVA